MYQNFFTKDNLVFGCGNPFFGDDGFGPAVIEHLEQNYEIPENTQILDAGTSIRDILFDILLSEEKPKSIIVIDAIDRNEIAFGTISEINVDEIPTNKTSDFSLHQFPTTNMLKELSLFTDIDVRVFVVQTEHIPEYVSPGLTCSVQNSISCMCDKIMETLSGL